MTLGDINLCIEKILKTGCGVEIGDIIKEGH